MADRRTSSTWLINRKRRHRLHRACFSDWCWIFTGDLAGTATPNTFALTGPNRTRLGNYTQINGKTIAISGTRRAIDQAGVADEYAYQLKKRGTELRRDLEWSLIHSGQVSVAPSGARTFGGYQSWINDDSTVVYAGTVGAAGTAATATAAGRPAAANQGVGTHAPAKRNNCS